MEKMQNCEIFMDKIRIMIESYWYKCHVSIFIWITKSFFSNIPQLKKNSVEFVKKSVIAFYFSSTNDAVACTYSQKYFFVENRAQCTGNLKMLRKLTNFSWNMIFSDKWMQFKKIKHILGSIIDKNSSLLRNLVHF